MLVKTLFYERLSNESQGAALQCNQHLEDTIIEMGYSLIPFSHQLNSFKSQIFIPWDRLKFTQLFHSQFSDIAIYCDRGVVFGLPSPCSSRINILVLHGLAYNFELINSLDHVDLIFTTSEYFAEVVKMMLGGLVVSNVEQLRDMYSFRSEDNETIIYPLMPPVEKSEFDVDRNDEFLNQFKLNTDHQLVLAHAVQPKKASIPAFVGIVVSLVSKFKELNKAFKVFTSSVDYNEINDELTHLSSLNWFDDFFNIDVQDVRDSFVYTDRLPQSDLHRLFSMSSLGLCYNEAPESFGMYVLESILNGCPIFSNGSGNMRYSLPANHGHYIKESHDIYIRNKNGLKMLASEIISKLGSSSLGLEIFRGQDFIQSNYNVRLFKREFRNIVKTLSCRNHQCQERINTNNTSVIKRKLYVLSPLVRSVYASSKCVIADHQKFYLSDNEFNLLVLISESSCIQLDCRTSVSAQSLIEKGLICLK